MFRKVKKKRRRYYRQIMRLLYINISLSKGEIAKILKRQEHTLLYKSALSETTETYYLLRGDMDLDFDHHGIKMIFKKRGGLSFIASAVRFAAVKRIDVVIVHGLTNILYAPVFKLMTKSKLVFQHHGERFYHGRKSWMMRFTDPFIDGYFFSGGDLAGDYIKNKCIQPSKVFEIPEASSGFRANGHASPSQKKMVFIGRLVPGKNLHVLLQALTGISADSYQLEIYYSDDTLLAELQRISAVLGLERNIHFKGFVPHTEIERILNGADIFISCSDYEGSGYALIEALACGTYPVVSDIGAFNYLLRGLAHKRQFKPGDHVALTVQLKSVLELEIGHEVRKEIRRHFESVASPRAVASQVKKAAVYLLSK